MKKIYLICAIFTLVLSGCTPKSQLYHSAKDSLDRVEAACAEISADVEKLGDEYTTGVFENIIRSAEEYREILSSNPSRDEIEQAIVSLSRLEKELGSIKTLSSGMEDYTPELTFEFANNTDEVIEKITLASSGKEPFEVYSGEFAPGTQVTISYAVEDGVWSVIALLKNGDEVTGEGINLSTINTLTLNSLDKGYEFTTN